MERSPSNPSRTRGAVMEAAALAFRENGFEQTSMDEIARRAGVARGTLYYNFDSKEDIAVAIAERYRAQGYARFLEKQAEGADPLALLDQFFTFAGQWIAENRAAAFIGTTAAIRGIGRTPDRPGTTLVFEALVREGQEAGIFRPDLPASSIARLLAALLTHAALLGPDTSSEDVAAWPRKLLHMALDGVLNPDTPLR